MYRITNLLTGKSYIGSSIDLGRRFMNYYSVNSLLKATGMAICRALLKYGYSSFKLEILEFCDKKDVLKREQYYLDSLKPEYNVLKTAGSSSG